MRYLLFTNRRHDMRLATLFALIATPAFADVSLTFIESAPKDRFVITNAGCPFGKTALTIDLRTAPAGVIFDVTASGAGVEVFQPVEVVAGDVTPSQVKDGDQVLTLQIARLATNADIVISADLDDLQTNGALGQIRVSGSEIAQTTATLKTDGATYTAIFADTATARFDIPAPSGGCPST